MVFADGAYENTEVFRNWALDAYHKTWELEFPEDEYEPPPKALLTVVSYLLPSRSCLTYVSLQLTRRVSWLRGEVKRRIRSIVQYGFGFRNPAISRADIKHNKRLAKKLGANVFHCRVSPISTDYSMVLTNPCHLKEHVPDTNYYEHPEFVRAIGAGLFWDPESLGVVFRERFEVIPLPAVALILTMVCH
jgi:hypothetical protein